MVMVGLLLAAALTFDCTHQFSDIEREGKVYNYSHLGKEKRELLVGGNSYQCVEDYPQPDDRPGIRTFWRRRCGPLTLFWQIYKKSALMMTTILLLMDSITTTMESVSSISSIDA